MAKLPKPLTSSNFKQFLDSFDTVLTDCDGVLWSGNTILGQANVAINMLHDLGKKVFYVTNNSTKSRDDFVTKCTTLGFKASKDIMLSSGYVMAEYLKQLNFNKKVYIVGTTGMSKELQEVGIKSIINEDDPLDDTLINKIEQVELDPDVGAVAVGFDPKFSFVKVLRAASYLDKPGCLFIATNTDERFPLSDRDLVCPGTGCLVKCVETVAERPAQVMGKPSEKMFTVISKKHNLDPARTLMIGDRCNTDILFGKNCGLQTMVVLSGVTSQCDLERWAESTNEEDHLLLADYSLKELGDMVPLLKSQK